MNTEHRLVVVKWDRLRRFLQCRLGVAGTEFALILPVAVGFIFLAGVCWTWFEVKRRVATSASIVADIAAQGNNLAAASLSADDLNRIVTYPQLTMYPFPASSISTVVSELHCDASLTCSVVLSAASRGSSVRPTGQVVAISPLSANLANAYLFYSELVYDFQPQYILQGYSPMRFTASSISVPRTSLKVN